MKSIRLSYGQMYGMLVGMLLWSAASVRGEKLPPPISGVVDVTVTATGQFSSKYSNPEEALADLDTSVHRLKVSGPLNGTDMMAVKELIGEKIFELDLSQAQLMGEGKYNSYYDMETDVIGQRMFHNLTNLVAIVLPTNLKGIDKEAFEYCQELVSVDASSPQLTSIDNEAFYYCRKLNTFTLNSTGLKTIGTNAFGYCSELPGFQFPSTVESIGNRAFYNCDKFTSIVLPVGLTSISEETFSDCNELLSVDASSPQLTTIGDRAFDGCNKLTTINLGSGLKTIGASAFDNCYQLTDILLPASLKNIGQRAFGNCSQLTSITLPEGVTTISQYLFTGCSRLTTVNIPSTVEKIDAYAFYYAGLDGNVQLPEGLKSIGSSAFLSAGKTSATIVIPTSVESIGSSAFENCYAQLSFAQPSNIRLLGRYAFNKSSNLTEAVLPKVETVEEGVFSECSNLTHVELPDNLTNLSASLFYGCSKLQHFQIPTSVQNIGRSAFSNCERLTGLTLPSQLQSIEDYAFYRCSQLSDIILPATVMSIGANAFDNCTSLTSIEIPEGVTEIASGLFSSCQNLKSVSLPSSINKIGNQAFFQCEALTNLTLPEDVKSIDYYAFGYCKSLHEMVFPANVEIIGDGALTNCEALENVTLPINLTLIPRSFFNNCTSLRHVTLPTGASLTNAESLFYNCTQLESITMPATADEIPESFCSRCASLQSIVIPAGVKRIGKSAFNGCTSLTELSLPEGIEIISESAFNNCSSLPSISFPASITTIGISAFSNCSSLLSVVIPAKVEVISKECFYKCVSLTSITLPEGLTTIGGEAFRFCSALEQISFPTTLTSIGNYAFSYCDKLQSITIPENFTTVPNYLCEYCTSLTNVTLPATITEIGHSAFYHCESLPEIELSDNITVIGSHAFSYTALTEIHIPTGLKKISHIVEHCSGITTITVPEGVIELDGIAGDCINLKSLFLPSTIEKISSYIIDGCPNITEVHLKAPTVTVSGSLYYIGRNTATLYVPKGSLSFYSDLDNRWNLAYGWKAIVEEDYTFAGLSDDEWQILRQLPQQTQGAHWKRQWTLADTAAESEIPEGVTMRDGHITNITLPNNNLQGELPATLFELPYLESLDLSRNQLCGQLSTIYNKVLDQQKSLVNLDLSGNQLTGNVYDLCQKLPSLTTLNVSGNRIRDAYPALPYTIEKLDLGRQDLSNEVVDFTYNQLYQMKSNPGKDVLPTILFYQHSTYRQEDCKYTDDIDFDLTEAISKPQWGVRIINHKNYSRATITNSYGLGNTCWYSQPSGQTIYAWGGYYSNSGRSYFPLIFNFEMGDVDLNTEIDLSDMQKTLRFAVDSVSYGKGNVFNWNAANLITDDVINVQDVVASINLLLDDDIVPHFARRKSNGSNEVDGNFDNHATLTLQEGQLVLRSEVPVGAIELVLSDTDVQWQPSLNMFSHKSRGKRTIFYSIYGDELSAGVHVLAQMHGTIIDAMLVDRDGQRIPLAIGDSAITDVQHITIQQKQMEQVFDLQGRPVSNRLQPGIYVKDGKKQVIK